MKMQITLTGGWKIMNMAKLGIEIQSEKHLVNENSSIKTMSHAIHYA
jgi:hypothetical protein